MNVLIVHAHPEPTSFVAAMTARARAALEEAGHRVQVSDLYAEGFDPVAGRHDFRSVADPARFHYQTEQEHASRHDGYADDLRREQARVAAADLLLFVFPLWWGGMPAILKGWFDRVLAYGFAYADGKRYDSGFLRGRRALLGIATGGTAQRFTRDGSYGDIEQVLHGVRRCMLEYLGLEVEAPFVAYAAPRVDDEERARMLAAWRARVTALAAQAAAAPQPDAGARLRRAQLAVQGDTAQWTLAR
ncbi:NAD(P)H-dependent oxidoreductase [uncultured Massilia sp.]|uniref:NAD(P)H-dependent oxidoreductase n=1 Tax=uncultured Massilia sp. TaxID=169973 RepID=UPI0025D4BC6B|nr:NAD(P)H-dependent oxidoreductase [uncultured Massilia sp.]